MDGPMVIALTALVFNLASIIRPVLACSGDKEKPLYDKDCQDDIEGTPQKKGNTYKCFRNESSDVCDICSCEICECTCSKVKEEKEKEEEEKQKEGEEGGRSGEEKEVETTKAQCKDECDKKAGGEGKQGGNPAGGGQAWSIALCFLSWSIQLSPLVK